MSYYLVEKALVKRYEDLATGIPTAYPNVNFDPVSADQYIMISMLGGETVSESKDCLDQESGIYQISIYTRAGISTKTAYNLADIIRANYKHGLELTNGTQKVFIENTSRGNSRNSDGWFIIDLSINYLANFNR